jgi:hypothetical protein
MRRRVAWSFATIIAVAFALCGCSTSSSPNVPSTTTAPIPSSAPASPALAATPFPSVTIIRGLPPNATGSSAFEAFAVWAEAGRLYVVTFGSSCPKVPTGVSASADNRLTVRAKPISDGPCTMDISPTTSLVDVPAGIDDSNPVEVTIDGVVSVLPPR